MNEEDHIKLVQDGYDRIALRYQADRLEFDISDQMAKFIENLPSRGHILDAGCGTGIPVAKTLIENGFEVTGIDISTKMIELAKEYVPKATFLRQDMTKISLDDETFDGAVSVFALIHVPRTLHSQVFGHFHRLLKTGGILLVSLGQDEWEGEGEYYGVEMYWSHFDKESSLDLLEKSGFTILWDSAVETREEFHYWILAKKDIHHRKMHP